MVVVRSETSKASSTKKTTTTTKEPVWNNTIGGHPCKLNVLLVRCGEGHPHNHQSGLIIDARGEHDAGTGAHLLRGIIRH